jgi:MFS transporter
VSDHTGQRTLRRFYVLRGVGMLANQLLQFAVPVVVFQHTGSIAWSGIALFVEWVPRLSSLPIAGPLVDHFGVRRVYLVSDLVRCIAALGAVAAVTFASKPVAVAAIVALTLVAGACFEQMFIAGEKAVRVLAPPAVMHRAQSVLGGIDQAVLLAAPALGGLLLLINDISTIAVTGVLFAVSLLLVWGLPELGGDLAVKRRDGIEVAKLLRWISVGVRRVMGEPILRDIVAITIVINLLFGLILAVTPAFVVDTLQLPSSYVGVLYTAGGLASIVVLAATPWLIRVFGLLRVGAASALVACAAIGVAGLPVGSAAFTALTTAFLVTESVFTVFIRTVRAHIVPAAEFGVTVSVIVLLNFLSMPVAGLLVAAFSWTLLPLPLLYLGTGAASLVACFVMLAHLARLMPQWRGVDRRWLIPALGEDVP